MTPRVNIGPRVAVAAPLDLIPSSHVCRKFANLQAGPSCAPQVGLTLLSMSSTTHNAVSQHRDLWAR